MHVRRQEVGVCVCAGGTARVFSHSAARPVGVVRVETLITDPTNVLVVCGVVYGHTQSAHRDAIKLYSKAISLMPDAARYHSNRGAAWLHVGAYAECIADCTRAVELQPDFTKVRPYNYSGQSAARPVVHSHDKAAATRVVHVPDVSSSSSLALLPLSHSHWQSAEWRNVKKGGR